MDTIKITDKVDDTHDVMPPPAPAPLAGQGEETETEADETDNNNILPFGGARTMRSKLTIREMGEVLAGIEDQEVTRWWCDSDENVRHVLACVRREDGEDKEEEEALNVRGLACLRRMAEGESVVGGLALRTKIIEMGGAGAVMGMWRRGTRSFAKEASVASILTVLTEEVYDAVLVAKDDIGGAILDQALEWIEAPPPPPSDADENAENAENAEQRMRRRERGLQLVLHLAAHEEVRDTLRKRAGLVELLADLTLLRTDGEGKEARASALMALMTDTRGGGSLLIKNRLTTRIHRLVARVPPPSSSEKLRTFLLAALSSLCQSHVGNSMEFAEAMRAGGDALVERILGNAPTKPPMDALRALHSVLNSKYGSTQRTKLGCLDSVRAALVRGMRSDLSAERSLAAACVGRMCSAHCGNITRFNKDGCDLVSLGVRLSPKRKRQQQHQQHQHQQHQQQQNSDRTDAKATLPVLPRLSSDDRADPAPALPAPAPAPAHARMEDAEDAEDDAAAEDAAHEAVEEKMYKKVCKRTPEQLMIQILQQEIVDLRKKLILAINRS